MFKLDLTGETRTQLQEEATLATPVLEPRMPWVTSMPISIFLRFMFSSYEPVRGKQTTRNASYRSSQYNSSGDNNSNNTLSFCLIEFPSIISG